MADLQGISCETYGIQPPNVPELHEIRRMLTAQPDGIFLKEQPSRLHRLFHADEQAWNLLHNLVDAITSGNLQHDLDGLDTQAIAPVGLGLSTVSSPLLYRITQEIAALSAGDQAVLTRFHRVTNDNNLLHNLVDPLNPTDSLTHTLGTASNTQAFAATGIDGATVYGADVSNTDDAIIPEGLDPLEMFRAIIHDAANNGAGLVHNLTDPITDHQPLQHAMGGNDLQAIAPFGLDADAVSAPALVQDPAIAFYGLDSAIFGRPFVIDAFGIHRHFLNYTQANVNSGALQHWLGESRNLTLPPIFPPQNQVSRPALHRTAPMGSVGPLPFPETHDIHNANLRVGPNGIQPLPITEDHWLNKYNPTEQRLHPSRMPPFTALGVPALRNDMQTLSPQGVRPPSIPIAHRVMQWLQPIRLPAASAIDALRIGNHVVDNDRPQQIQPEGETHSTVADPLTVDNRYRTLRLMAMLDSLAFGDESLGTSQSITQGGNNNHGWIGRPTLEKAVYQVGDTMALGIPLFHEEKGEQRLLPDSLDTAAFLPASITNMDVYMWAISHAPYLEMGRLQVLNEDYYLDMPTLGDTFLIELRHRLYSDAQEIHAPALQLPIDQVAMPDMRLPDQLPRPLGIDAADFGIPWLSNAERYLPIPGWDSAFVRNYYTYLALPDTFLGADGIEPPSISIRHLVRDPLQAVSGSLWDQFEAGEHAVRNNDMLIQGATMARKLVAFGDAFLAWAEQPIAPEGIDESSLQVFRVVMHKDEVFAKVCKVPYIPCSTGYGKAIIYSDAQEIHAQPLHSFIGFIGHKVDNSDSYIAPQGIDVSRLIKPPYIGDTTQRIMPRLFDNDAIGWHKLSLSKQNEYITQLLRMSGIFDSNIGYMEIKEKAIRPMGIDAGTVVGPYIGGNRIVPKGFLAATWNGAWFGDAVVTGERTIASEGISALFPPNVVMSPLRIMCTRDLNGYQGPGKLWRQMAYDCTPLKESHYVPMECFGAPAFSNQHRTLHGWGAGDQFRMLNNHTLIVEPDGKIHPGSIDDWFVSYPTLLGGDKTIRIWDGEPFTVVGQHTLNQVWTGPLHVGAGDTLNMGDSLVSLYDQEIHGGGIEDSHVSSGAWLSHSPRYFAMSGLTGEIGLQWISNWERYYTFGDVDSLWIYGWSVEALDDRMHVDNENQQGGILPAGFDALGLGLPRIGNDTYTVGEQLHIGRMALRQCGPC